MKTYGPDVCARLGCHRQLVETKTIWKDGLPYCCEFCFKREHAGQVPDAPLQIMLLQEK